jgi:acyl transferase domain-containing protein
VNRENLDAHTGVGTSMGIAANRISYVYNLLGPSMTVDTACSSAMVAIHLACQSLRNRECAVAVAGGVNALLRPEFTIATSKASMLSPDSRSKSFDAAANGYARSEGIGIVVLKPLAQALADGDPIYAVIRGSAVNQDGHSNGLTVPNGSSQEAALRAALGQAGVSPLQVQYAEAHGTGTPVGDPVEANALGNVLGRCRAEGERLVMGSVKSNIGHTESASGAVSLIKVALALRHGQIPPNLHFHKPNPAIPFDELKVRVPTSLEPWPDAGEGPRTAVINSFGFGGTNSSMVVQEAPPAAPACFLFPGAPRRGCGPWRNAPKNSAAAQKPVWKIFVTARACAAGI